MSTANRTRRPLEFLFATWSGGGNVPPVLAAAQKLLAPGHRVRILSEACDRADIEAVGAEFRAWTTAPSRADRGRDSDFLRDWEADGPVDGIGRLLDTVVAGPALSHARDLKAELARAPADLVVSSEMLMGVLAACEALRQPAVILAPNICLFPIEGAPSVVGGLGPAESDAARAALAAAQAGMSRLMDSRLPALNAARTDLGLPPLGRMLDQFSAVREHLLATSAAFDFPWPDRPADFRYVGPQMIEPPGVAWASPWPARDTRPLVLVGFSTTFQGHVDVLQRVLDGLATLPVRVLLTTGETIDPAELGAPENAILVRKAPHMAVIREAAAVVTHGGHGTVIRALAAGLPTLVVPHGRDQHDNARRVTERGAGLELAAGAPAEAFAEAVLRLLQEPGFRVAAERLGRAVRADVDASPIVEVLEAAARVPAHA
jgi:MGT family glycosyltransferase